MDPVVGIKGENQVLSAFNKALQLVFSRQCLLRLVAESGVERGADQRGGTTEKTDPQPQQNLVDDMMMTQAFEQMQVELRCFAINYWQSAPLQTAARLSRLMKITSRDRRNTKVGLNGNKDIQRPKPAVLGTAEKKSTR